MKILLIITFTLSFASLFAQNPSWEWAHPVNDSIGYDYRDAVQGLICTSNNDFIYSAGNFYGKTVTINGVTLNGQSDFNNFFIIKYDSNGNLIWANSYSAESYSVLKGIETDSNGNVIATGQYSGNWNLGSITLNSLGAECFILKIDGSGNVVWALSPNGSAQGNSITTIENEILVTGWFNADHIYFDNDTLTGGLTKDIFVVKLDEQGSSIWARTYGNGYGNDVSHDKFGNIYITGAMTQSSPNQFDSITIIAESSWDSYLAKIDPNGNVIWAKNGGKIGNDNEGYNIATDSLGNTYMIGQFFPDSINFMGIPLNNNSNVLDDYYLAKINSMGFIEWVRNDGGLSHEFAYGLDTDSLGNVYIAGTFWSSEVVLDADTIISSGDKKMAVVKYNNNGDYLWHKTTQNANGNDNYAQNIAVNSAGDIFINGGFDQPQLILDNINLSQTPSSNNNFFTSKLSQCYTQPAYVSDTSCQTMNYNGIDYYSTGQYTQVLQGASGCDSIIYLDLLFKGSDTTINKFSCGPYTHDSITYLNSGIYYQVYNNLNGCDSVVTIQLETDIIDAQVSQSSSILHTSGYQQHFDHQWFDCSNDSILIGETSPVFQPSENGTYGVILTSPLGCTDTSDCHTISDLSLVENDINAIKIYPNPSSNNLTVKTGFSTWTYKIYSMNGSLMLEGYSDSEEKIINISNFSNGKYSIFISHNGKSFIKEFIKH